MKPSKRTLILAVAAVVLFAAALASLYFEMNEIIKELESIEDYPDKSVKRTINKKTVIDEPLKDENNGTETGDETKE